MARFFGPGRLFTKGPTGIPARVEDAEVVRDSMFSVIMTRKGQRVMRPEFGTRVLDLVFETQGPLLKGRLNGEIRQGVRRFEPRAEVLTVRVSEEDDKTYVDVDYAVLDKTQSLGVEVETG